jgi:predicted membrane channel-forming protein YqfA (hemolysin III family)
MGNRLAKYAQFQSPTLLLSHKTAKNHDLFPKDGSIYHYIDGREKPYFRGCLHFVVSNTISCVILLKLFEPTSVKRLYLLGKLSSYLVSTLYHFYDFKTVGGMDVVRWLDSCMIYVSIAVSGLCFSNVHYRWHVMMCSLGFYYENFVLRYVYGLVTMGSILRSGVSVSWWSMMMANYVLGCVLFTMKFSGKYELFHHRRQLWGYHEDVHLFLLLADMIPLMF